jgi:hypothetical protein
LWQCLIHYRNTVLGIAHCLRYIRYKQCFGSLLYSRLHVIGCHYTDTFIPDSCHEQQRNNVSVQWQSIAWRREYSQLPKRCVYWIYIRQWTLFNIGFLYMMSFCRIFFHVSLNRSCIYPNLCIPPYTSVAACFSWVYKNITMVSIGFRRFLLTYLGWLTVLFQLQRLFSVELCRKMMVLIELTRVMEEAVVICFKVRSRPGKNRGNSQDSWFPGGDSNRALPNCRLSQLARFKTYLENVSKL